MIDVRDTLCPIPGDETRHRDWRNHSGRPRCRAAQLANGSIEYMLRHLDKPLRVSTLISMAGFSDSYFFALFKSATGYAPIEFFIRLRMQRACKMLTARTISVKEVAAGLGYKDRFYFSRLFKSVIGIPPRDYRRMMIRSRQSPSPHSGCQSPEKNGSLENASMNLFGLVAQASVWKGQIHKPRTKTSPPPNC